MSPLVQVDRATKGDGFRMGPSWTIQSFSSKISSGGMSGEQPSAIQTSKPSKYLRRPGLVPNGINLQLNPRHKTSILSSASSSTVTSPSLAAPNRNIGARGSPAQSGTPSLPSLTESNLARFMTQLSLSTPPHPFDQSTNTLPRNALEKSYFSDGSSTHSGSDCASSPALGTCQ